MKNFFAFIFLLAAVFMGSFVFAPGIGKKEAKAEMEIAARFKPTEFALKNHPFTIVVVGVNNGANVAKTLTSVFAQNYEKYKVIYIDDASDDGSFDLARDIVYDSDHLPQVTLV